MSIADYKSNLRLVRGFSAEFLSVLRQKSRPSHLVLHYHRAILMLLFLYPNKKLSANPLYRQCHFFIVGNLTFFLFAVICAVHESKNVVDMGDDMVWIIGITLIYTKIIYIHLRANKIDEVIEDFDYYQKVLRPRNNDAEVFYWQRLCYLAESCVFINILVLMSLFNVAICMQPLVGNTDLPFHVNYPYNLHRADEHPKAHWFFYIWQCITSHHNLMSILQIDLLGIHTFMQTALNLKILCIEMRKLGKLQVSDDQFHEEFRRIIKFHQHIISTVQKNNRVFYGSFVTQMIASFALVSMSTFETMAATDAKVATKFMIFMLLTFIQLSYWCLAGTLVYSQSMEVSQAAFDINDWHTRPVYIQRDILFVILRSQKPLEYVAKPFLPFTLGTYTIILKQCYRILALLRESM